MTDKSGFLVRQQDKLIETLRDERSAGKEAAAPWSTGNFNGAWRDVTEGCAAIIDRYLEVPFREL